MEIASVNKTSSKINRCFSFNSIGDSKLPFFKPAIQRKLSNNQSNDIYEQEADAVADTVMRKDELSSEKKFFPPPVIQRKCAACEEEEKEKNVQRKETGDEAPETSSQTENYLSSLSGGKKLSDEEKNFFEPGMGADLSNVRIHTDDAANESAKNIPALAYTHGNNIVFGRGQYQPNTVEGKKLLAHELTHTIQQNGNISKKIQAKRELNHADEEATYTKCLAAIDNVITKLEANATKQNLPDDIKEAIKLLRKKYTDKKIKCYYLDGRNEGETNFSTGEIHMDAKLLQDTTDTFANIGEGTVLHEGIHALHNEKNPVSTKKYGKLLDDQAAGKTVTLSKAEEQEMQKLDAWTEYWAHRKMQEYDNAKNNVTKTDDELHNATLKDMRSRGRILPLNIVWAFDKNWDPRKWKPKS